MKNFTLSLLVLLSLTTRVNAQQAVLDSVIMGASYANEVYYILEDGSESVLPADDWHIGFQTNAYSASIISNAASATVKVWPNGTNADFETLDTTGYSTWPTLYNDSLDFYAGAFNSNGAGGMDYGWGAYNPVTHLIVGDSVYLVKVGTAVYKVDFVNRELGTYNIRYADVSATAGTDIAIAASSYNTKDLVFFNLVDGEIKDRELENWDLWAVKYHDYYGGTAPNQVVTGILTNPKWEVSVISVGSGNQSSHTDYESGVFTSDKNELGQSYKFLNVSFQWEVTDSDVYYLKNAAGDVWKWYPTLFVGTSMGKTVFNKEKIAFAGINNQEIQFLDIYPNPATSNIVLAFDSKSTTSTIEIYNNLGQIVAKESFNTELGIVQKQMDISHLDNGAYFIVMNQNNSTITKSIIKQ